VLEKLHGHFAEGLCLQRTSRLAFSGIIRNALVMVVAYVAMLSVCKIHKYQGRLVNGERKVSERKW
jgi:hypothetical protein